MFSLLLASINIHYNVSLSERINSFHLQLPEITSAKAPNISHSPAGQYSAKVGQARVAAYQIGEDQVSGLLRCGISARLTAALGLGRVKTKSDLVVVSSGG
jgi:hypothetical protein